jgi:hypothetical protein
MANYNFRWLATAGSGLAKVEGSVKDTIDVKVTYDLSKFSADGKVSMHLVREPRNETCLNCHSKPQWKKRGASFTEFTDVHIAKGMKCVDCHVSGSMATDSRIKGKEVHRVMCVMIWIIPCVPALIAILRVTLMLRLQNTHGYPICISINLHARLVIYLNAR